MPPKRGLSNMWDWIVGPLAGWTRADSLAVIAMAIAGLAAYFSAKQAGAARDQARSAELQAQLLTDAANKAAAATEPVVDAVLTPGNETDGLRVTVHNRYAEALQIIAIEVVNPQGVSLREIWPTLRAGPGHRDNRVFFHYARLPGTSGQSGTLGNPYTFSLSVHPAVGDGTLVVKVVTARAARPDIKSEHVVIVTGHMHLPGA